MNHFLATAFLAAAVTATPVLAEDDSSPSWLFVQSAPDVMIVPMDREIFAFTDRPYRKHHYLNAHEFAALWKGENGTFKADPPNAVLTWVENGEVHEMEVELRDARVGNHGRTIHYEISVEEGVDRLDTVEDASLFIDACGDTHSTSWCQEQFSLYM